MAVRKTEQRASCSCHGSASQRQKILRLSPLPHKLFANQTHHHHNVLPPPIQCPTTTILHHLATMLATTTLLRRSAPRLAKDILARQSGVLAQHIFVPTTNALLSPRTFSTLDPNAVVKEQPTTLSKKLRVLNVDVVKNILNELNSVDVNHDGR